MADLATLLAQEAALVAALGRGVLRVTSGGETIEYRSVDDLLKALTETRRLIAAAKAADSAYSPRVRVVYTSAAKHL